MKQEDIVEILKKEISLKLLPKMRKDNKYSSGSVEDWKNDIGNAKTYTDIYQLLHDSFYPNAEKMIKFIVKAFSGKDSLGRPIMMKVK